MSTTYTRAQVMRLLDGLMAERALAGAEERADLRVGLEALPYKERLICYRLALGFSNKDIARSEGVSKATGTRIVRAALGQLVERMNGR